jgi:hypothetical protein
MNIIELILNLSIKDIVSSSIVLVDLRIKLILFSLHNHIKLVLSHLQSFEFNF